MAANCADRALALGPAEALAFELRLAVPAVGDELAVLGDAAVKASDLGRERRGLAGAAKTTTPASVVSTERAQSGGGTRPSRRCAPASVATASAVMIAAMSTRRMW